MEKIRKLYEVSDPETVQRRAMELHLNEIHPSSRKDKKFMVFNGDRMVHFGSISYEDYTKHKDQKRREKFRKRNAKWKNAEVYSPAWLSYWLLW